MTLFALKGGRILNLDAVTSIAPQVDPVSKREYLDLDFGGRNISIKDEDDLAAFAVVAGRLTLPRE